MGKRVPIITISAIMMIMVVVSSNLNWSKDFWKDIIEADAKGNYAYLPAVFIYHDLNFGFFDKIEREKYYNKNLFYDYRAQANGKTINKYFCGTALAQLPFFLIAHAVSQELGFDADGYSKPYPVLISLAALCYLFLGLVFLNRLLGLYGVEKWNGAIVLTTAVFGTNLFYYTVGEPGMSHIYSFAFISMFLYYGKSYFNHPATPNLILLAALTGIIILIRPVNGVILLSVPFLAGGMSKLKSGWSFYTAKAYRYIFTILIVFLIVAIQPIIYKLSTGSFGVYSYGAETFNFLRPHMIDILFSYKKGLFLYSPVLLISLSGGLVLWKRNRFEFFTLFSFLIFLTYLLSSWWNWWYGGSFSSRVYLEYLPFFTILLGLSLKNIHNKLALKSFIALIFVLVVVCQIQTFQYRYYHIHWENMTREKYWEVFLRVDKL